MPTSEEILGGLGVIANNWRWFAILWHGYFAVIILALILGIRPSKRIFGVLLTLPLLSVSVLAWLNANAFNGGFFAIVAIALGFIALKLPAGAIRIGPIWLTAVGTLMLGFGWVYPHFLVGHGFAQYLYAAPTGLIPCPTISIVIGVSLILGGLGSRAWCLVLAFIGLFYGAFGAVKLGVLIDLTLFAGALVVTYVGLSKRLASTPMVDVR